MSQAPKIGVERSDREMAYLIKGHNDSVDVRRGKRAPDVLCGRSWDEERARKLWTHIRGPSPGGNQQMPAQVAEEGGPAKVDSNMGPTVVRIQPYVQWGEDP